MVNQHKYWLSQICTTTLIIILPILQSYHHIFPIITFIGYLHSDTNNFLKNCKMLVLAYFILARSTSFVMLMLIRFELISVFKADEGLVFVMESAGL